MHQEIQDRIGVDRWGAPLRARRNQAMVPHERRTE